MVRESASGSRTPEGPDAFSPTTQLATFADDEALWNNVIVRANAAARNALAAPELRDGILVVQEDDGSIWECLDASGPTWIRVFTQHNRQTDTTNSLIDAITQTGIGKITGSASPTLSEAVTFPVAFSGIPVVVASCIGFRATGAFNAAGLTAAQSLLGSPQIPSATGFTAYIYQTTGGNLTSANDYYYAWRATGVPA
jgi:hypothetical protein